VKIYIKTEKRWKNLKKNFLPTLQTQRLSKEIKTEERVKETLKQKESEQLTQPQSLSNVLNFTAPQQLKSFQSSLTQEERLQKISQEDEAEGLIARGAIVGVATGGVGLSSTRCRSWNTKSRISTF